MNIETRKRVRKYGNSYVVTIPAAYVNDGLLQEGERVIVRISRITESEPILAHDALSGVLSRDSKDLSFLGQLSRFSGHHTPESPDCPDHRVPVFACGTCDAITTR